MSMSTTPAGAPRSCAGCTLCCKLVPVDALAKPGGVWCGHCRAGQGCAIYADRPFDCRTFQCGYLIDPNLDARWFPERCKLVVTADATRVVIHVDPGRPDAWRREPYYAHIKRWAVTGARLRRQVLVLHGRSVTAVLPDRDKPLGEIGPDQFVLTTEYRTPAGLQLDAVIVGKDDPRLPPQPAPATARPS